MTHSQNLHMAIGELAYAIARADGAIQKEEKEKLMAIAAEELNNKEYDFDVTEVIFQVLEKDRYVDSNMAYDWAMNEIRTNSNYLSPKLKEACIRVMAKVAKAFPPVTKEESELMERFKKDIKNIHGDPVYYAKSGSL